MLHQSQWWALLALAGSALALPQVGGEHQLNEQRSSTTTPKTDSIPNHTPVPTPRPSPSLTSSRVTTHPSPSAKPSFSKLTEIPSGAAQISQGPWSLPVSGLATTCTGAAVPFQTSFFVKTGQQSFVGAEWFEGKSTNWTISTDTPGVVLGVPYVPAMMDSETAVSKMQFDIVNRTRKNMVDLSIGPIGKNMIQMQIYNDNGSSIPEDAWRLKPGQKSSERDDLDGLGLEDVVANLTISGYGVCEFPVDPNVSCDVGNIELTPDNWMGYHVDEFFDKWLKSKNGDFGQLGMMELFKSDYGINTDVCTVQKPCDALQKCSNQADGTAKDSIPAYLVYTAMVNLSNFLNTLYSNVVTNSVFQTNTIDTLVQKFFKDPQADYKIPKPYISPFAEAGGWLGMVSFLGMFAGPAGMGLSAAGGVVSGALSMKGLYDIGPQGGKPIGELNFARGADMHDSLNQYVGDLQYQLRQWHVSTINQGVGVQDMFKEGIFVDRQMVELNTTATSAAAGWLNQYVMVKLINHAWWSQSAYITFMPYGQVFKGNGILKGDETQDFNGQQCWDNFQQKFKDQVILCDASDIFNGNQVYPNGGMARITWYDPSPSKAGPGQCRADGVGGQATHQTLDIKETIHGAIKEKTSSGEEIPYPSFVSADGNYTFDPVDVIKSSLDSWLNHGFGYDAVGALTDQISGGPKSTASLDAMAGFRNMKPSDAGMFNLPVLVVNDLDHWPDFSTDSGLVNYAKEVYQQDGLNRKITDENVSPPALRDFFTRNDGNLPVIKNNKCR